MKVACPVLRGVVAGNGLRLLDIDVVASIVIALIIAKAGLDVVREVSFTLLDALVLDTDMSGNIALEIEGVEDCHNIRIKGTADNVYVDLHVHVMENMHMNEAHCIAHAVENRFKERAEVVKDVVVHLDPEIISGKDKPEKRQ